MPSPLIGQMLGQYRIVDEIGAGGMGVVYKAQDTRLGRMVALKVLPQSASADEEAIERFRREARTASSLNHPNICTIYSFDDFGGQLYLAMELLDGEPLDKKLSGRALDLRTLLDVGIQIGDALDAAHSEGILHRDIKPANIFLTRRGQVKVLDFGLAKLAPGHAAYGFEAHPTQQFSSIAGTTVGTIAYMSPEQARGEDLDPRTDLFSFGVVLYEMATGRQSFPGATTAVVFDGILNRDPFPPSRLNASVPSELDRIISKSLDKERALRYQTAADMRADLQRLKRDSGSRRVQVPPPLDNSSAATVTLTSDPMAAAAPPASDGDVTRMWMPPTASTSTASPAPSASAHGGSSTVTPALSSTQFPSASEPPIARQESHAGQAPALPLPAPGAERSKWAGLSPLTIAALVIFVVGLASMLLIARFLTRGDTAVQVADQTTAAPPAAAPIEPANQSTEAPASVAAPSTVPPPVTNTTPASVAPVTPPIAPTPANRGAMSPANRSAASPAKGSGTAASSATIGAATSKNATAKAPVAPPPVETPPPPPPPNPELEANTRLDPIRAKIAANNFDPAVAELRQLAAEFPGSSAAAEASYMIAEVLEKQGRVDEAITAHTEFGKRFATHTRGAASRLRLAELVGRTRRSDREEAQRAIFAEVFTTYPRTPQALQALQLKLRLDGGRRQREMDPVLGVQVPAMVPTLRTLTEQFPTSPIAMGTFARLAEAYEDLGQYARAAQAYVDLATNFPNNPHDAWYHAGELYERRFKDTERARDAYSKVPAGSSRYRDAQRKLGKQ